MTCKEEYLIIQINHSHAGLFAYVNFAINQIIYAEKNDLIPVVYFGPQSGDGPNAYYDKQYGENTWDYYFQPVADITHTQLLEKISTQDADSTIPTCTSLSTGQLWRLHCKELDSVYLYPHGRYKDDQVDDSWYQLQRAKAQRVIQQYIRVKPHIQDKVEQFKTRFFGADGVLGIHLRGTDKGTANAHPALMRIIRPEQYFPHIDHYLNLHADSKIFVATDQQQFQTQIVARYGARVISTDSIRATGLRSVFEKHDGHGYQKGEEVLIDSLLLSQCDFLLKCTSAVGEFAHYFNPMLTGIDLNHIHYRDSMRTKLSVNLKRKLHLSMIKPIYAKIKRSTHNS